jgi:CubicO group peptidase (beta-lactamase class C family)
MRPWRSDGVTPRPAAAAALAVLTLAVAGGRPNPGFAESNATGPGFSRAKLERVGELFRNEIATGKIPGAILLIQQHGHPVYFENFGVRDPGSTQRMTADTIFRLYSMSKPITSVAAMMLVDDGRLRLDDPLSKYIPVFADVKVGVERADASGNPRLTLEPLKRPITIEDLLRHTSGMTYGFGGGAVGNLVDKAGLLRGNLDNAELTERISKLPLAAQPGTLWDYSYSTDVLGRVIEVVSGQTLFEFEKERLLDPLGMSDTAFYLAYRAKGSLIAQPLREERARMSDPLRWQRLQSGGIGMIGTIGDYARFAQMLLNGGTLDGKRYLKPGTVALMTSDHIGPETRIAQDSSHSPAPYTGFGLGVAVQTVKPSDTRAPIGVYGWAGAGGTFFFIDPRDDLFVVCLMQTLTHGAPIQAALKTLIYEALEN